MPARSEDWLAEIPAAPPLRAPASLKAWLRLRARIRRQLFKLLQLRCFSRPGPIKIIAREERDDHILERFQFANGAGAKVPGLLLLPRKSAGKVPGILYCHWHGGEYDLGKAELFEDKHTPEAPGLALVRRGCAVLSIDAYCFGERNGCGPGPAGERDAAGEMSAAKFFLWAGTSLWAMMLRDDLITLDYLMRRPEVDPSRIGVMGMSMGATRAWWLMALSNRIATGVSTCCLTRYRDLVQANGLAEHGIYYYVPGLLAQLEAEHIVSLIAPRPILFLNGDHDPTSPVGGIRKIISGVRPVYRLHSAEKRLQSVIYPEQGHIYTPEMWQHSLAWLDRHLNPSGA